MFPKIRLMLLILLLCALSISAGAAVAADIEDATCEQTGPSSYRINFHASSDTGPVEIFASSRPDWIDSTKAVATVRTTSATVSVPGRTGRVYFHLKPRNGLVRVVSIRRLPLEGAVNFRDLGGYSTADGHRVKWGMVYRSNQLAGLTSRDYEYLGSLGIHLVCDLRTDWERKRSPTKWRGEAPEFLIAAMGDEAQVQAAMEQIKRSFDEETRSASAVTSEAGPVAKNQFGYYQMLTENSAQYAQILRRIAHGDLPTLTHCTGGADRTGIFSAVLLATLGVPRNTIIQDYLLTRQYFLDETNIQGTAADVQRILGLDRTPDPAFIRKIFTGLDGSLMEGMFEMIDKNSGSFDTFVRDVLRVSDGDVALLRQNLLEK